MLDVPRIKSILKRASWMDMDYSLFGSHRHAHLFRPPLPMEDLDTWEDLMELQLPQDYRTYLTCLGNGGAGPSYGLKPFQCPLYDWLREPAVFSDDQSERFNELAQKWCEDSNSDTDLLYEEYCARTPEHQQMSYSEWDEKQYRFIKNTVMHPLFKSGQLFIANQGCSQDILLLLNGTHRGFCHGNSSEYDYSYPFWYQQADHRAAITWPQYRDTLITFEDYFMDYVDRVEKVCENLPSEKEKQFRWERSQVRDFQSASKAGDWESAIKLMLTLEPATLSIKSRSFYLHYEDMLKAKFPDCPDIPIFFQKVQKTRRYTGGSEFTECWNEKMSTSDYPAPDFSDFVNSFFEGS